VARRVGLRQLGPWYGLAVALLKPLVVLTARRRWEGTEHVPAAGGVVLASNHISHADPFYVAELAVHGLGRAARFMAKSSLFTGNGLVARVMRGAGQIPVHRDTEGASHALRDAVAALRAGECVVIYPEGTVTRDPGKWPMQPRTGVARLALLSGAPVVPLAQWGAQEVHDTYRRPGLRLLPRADVVLRAGPAVDLSAYDGQPLTADVLRGATDEVMDAITSMLEELRGEQRPAVRHVHRRAADRRPA
jgi:1-acyl-sn-glycerol-3-phosphate acyltransferase